MMSNLDEHIIPILAYIRDIKEYSIDDEFDEMRNIINNKQYSECLAIDGLIDGLMDGLYYIFTQIYRCDMNLVDKNDSFYSIYLTSIEFGKALKLLDNGIVPSFNITVKFLIEEITEIYMSILKEKKYVIDKMSKLLIESKDCTEFKKQQSIDFYIKRIINLLYECLKEYAIDEDIDKWFNIIHEANMRKIDYNTGLPYIVKNGKIMKPVGWVHPELNIKLSQILSSDFI